MHRINHLAIFASGRGSNARKIIEHLQGNTSVVVSLVVSNNIDAPVLEMAGTFNIPTFVIDRKTLKIQSQYVLDILDTHKVDYIVLAGFLLLIPPYLIYHYPERIVNIHPALLPKYGGKGMYGMHVHEAVKMAGERVSGITIHYVNEKYDEGKIIFQAECTIEPEDSAEDIAQKVLTLEHTYFPVVVEELAKKIRVHEVFYYVHSVYCIFFPLVQAL